MSIVLIIIYCLTAALILFGLLFHDELTNEEKRKRKSERPFVVLNGGKRKLRRHA